MTHTDELVLTSRYYVQIEVVCQQSGGRFVLGIERPRIHAPSQFLLCMEKIAFLSTIRRCSIVLERSWPTQIVLISSAVLLLFIAYGADLSNYPV